MRRPAGLPPSLAASEETLVMGILNVTPDSFSDGGLHDRLPDAVRHGRQLAGSGAAIVDVGGESTRPGAERVDLDEELRRVVPVVQALAADGICVSVDTMRAAVASECVRAGAIVVNDVSGGLADDQMASTCAELRTSVGSPPVLVAMHWRGHSDQMADRAVYDDVTADVTEEIAERVRALESAGVDRRSLVVDPGLGFAKDADHDWELLAHLDELAGLGLPLLVGASRKRSVAALGADRDAATAAISAHAAFHGAWCVRVHEVVGSVAAVRVARALAEHGA